MSKGIYYYPDGCREISGFGGSYEKACRELVILCMDYFYDHTEQLPIMLSLKTYFDLDAELPDLAKIIYDLGDELGGFTGAMVGASLSHVKFAVRHGWIPYTLELQKIEKQDWGDNT